MSRRASFTPGPWIVKNETDVFTPLGHTSAFGTTTDDTDGWHIADCAPSASFVGGELVSLDRAEEKANTRLVAAAPDLLEALELARMELECLGGELSRLNGESPSMVCALMDPEVINRVDAAIAKAKGADHERN